MEFEIQAIRKQLHEGGELSDAGRKARDNVRKAIAAVKNELRPGEKPQKDFLRHIDTLIRTGYWCEYAQAEGKIWE